MINFDTTAFRDAFKPLLEEYEALKSALNPGEAEKSQPPPDAVDRQTRPAAAEKRPALQERVRAFEALYPRLEKAEPAAIAEAQNALGKMESFRGAYVVLLSNLNIESVADPEALKWLPARRHNATLTTALEQLTILRQTLDGLAGLPVARLVPPKQLDALQTAIQDEIGRLQKAKGNVLKPSSSEVLPLSEALDSEAERMLGAARAMVEAAATGQLDAHPEADEAWKDGYRRSFPLDLKNGDHVRSLQGFARAALEILNWDELTRYLSQRATQKGDLLSVTEALDQLNEYNYAVNNGRARSRCFEMGYVLSDAAHSLYRRISPNSEVERPRRHFTQEAALDSPAKSLWSLAGNLDSALKTASTEALEKAFRANDDQPVSEQTAFDILLGATSPSGLKVDDDARGRILRTALAHDLTVTLNVPVAIG
jgi:hypothetical protein